MKILFFILSVLISLSAVYAQTPDQYRELLKSGTDKERIEASWELFKHFRLSDRDSALVYAKLNNQMAKEAGDQLALVKSYNALGFLYRVSADFVKCVAYYDSGISIAKEYEYWDQVKFLLNNKAVAYVEGGRLEPGLQTHFESLKIKKMLNDTIGEAISYNNIGLVYYDMKLHNKALEYFSKSLRLKMEAGEINGGILTLINIGNSHIGLENYKESLEFYDKAIKLCEGLCDQFEYLIIHSARMYSFYYLKDYKKALNECERALIIASDLDEKTNLIESYYMMSKIYLALNNRKQSLNLLSKADSIAQETDSRPWKMEIAKLQFQQDKETGNHQKALEHYEKYTAYKDSLLNKESLQKMADLRTEYEVGQKQAEVDLLTAEKKNQQIIIYATTGGGVLILAMLGLVYKNYRDKNRINRILEEQKAQLEALNSTKDKFFSIISHDLRGPVSAFSGITRLIKHAVENKAHDDLVEISDHIDESVAHLSGLLDNLLSWAMQQQGHFPNVPEKLNLKEIADEIKGIFSNTADAKQIDLKVDVPNDINLWADKNTSMTIVRNLVNNALKFTKSGGEVRVAAQQNGNMAEIIVSDTGVGMSEEKLKTLFQLQGTKSDFGTSGEKGLGLGLQLVYEFVEMNNGTIKVDSEEGKGTTFTIQLPLFEYVNQRVAS